MNGPTEQHHACLAKKKVRKRLSSPPSSPWSRCVWTKVFERYVRDLLWRSRTRITGIVPDRQDENEMTPVIAMRKTKGDTERKIPLISSGRRCTQSIIDRTGRTHPARQSDSKILKSYFHTSVCNCIKSKSLSAERTWSCHPNQYLRLH